MFFFWFGCYFLRGFINLCFYIFSDFGLSEVLSGVLVWVCHKLFSIESKYCFLSLGVLGEAGVFVFLC